jgi:NADPH-dependent 2,4-dienoyl-CoA reductase/sulfur reductase-like enzyme
VSLSAAVGVDGRLVAVETSDGDRIACDVLAVSSGVRPRAALAAAAGLLVERGVLTDVFLETTAADVFAAGDVAQVPDAPGGRGTLDTLWASAEAQGRSAGLNMTGARQPHLKNAAVNVTRLAGIAVTIAGAVGGGSDPDLLAMTRGQSERWDAPDGATSVAGARGDDRLRVVVHDDLVIGVVAMGVDRLERPLSRLLGRRMGADVRRAAAGASPEEAFDALCAGCTAMLAG